VKKAASHAQQYQSTKATIAVACWFPLTTSVGRNLFVSDNGANRTDRAAGASAWMANPFVLTI
jgi:hypothetical protein